MRLVPLVLERDLDQILRIEEDLFGPERWTAAMFRSELDAGRYYLVALADEADDVLGYAGLAVVMDEAWVNNLAVRRESHGKGWDARCWRRCWPRRSGPVPAG